MDFDTLAEHKLHLRNLHIEDYDQNKKSLDFP
jgi:hypothetical protein